MDTKERYAQIVPWSKVGISNDLMFMLVMSNRKHCRRLLEVLLGIKVKRFKKLTSQKSIATDIRSKGIRLDICVETADCIYDIEMQTVNTSINELGKRVRYYQSEIDRKCLRRGQHYRKLRQSVIIFICTFDPFGKNLYQYTFSNRCHEDLTIDLMDGALKIFFYTGGDMTSATPAQKAFLKYVSGKKAEDNFTKELDKSVEVYRGDGEQEAAYMSLEQMLMDVREDAKTEAMEHMKQMLMDVREDTMAEALADIEQKIKNAKDDARAEAMEQMEQKIKNAKEDARAEAMEQIEQKIENAKTEALADMEQKIQNAKNDAKKEGLTELIIKNLKKGKLLTEIVDNFECSRDFVLDIAKANNIKVNDI